MLCNVLSTLEKISSFHASQPTEKITIIISHFTDEETEGYHLHETLQEMLLEDCSHRKYAA